MSDYFYIFNFVKVEISTCAEEGWWIYWRKDVKYGAARKEERKNGTEIIHGCIKGGNVEGWLEDDKDRVNPKGSN